MELNLRYTHKAAAESVYFHKLGIYDSLVATADSEFGVTLFDMGSLKEIWIIPGAHDERIVDIKFIDSNVFYSASQDGKIKLWDARTAESQSLISTRETIDAFAYNSTYPVMAIGSGCEISFWDRRSLSCAFKNDESHSEVITQLQFHPLDQKVLFSSSEDGLVCLLEVDSPDNSISVLPVEEAVSRFGFYGPGANGIYCVDHSETVSLWDFALVVEARDRIGRDALQSNRLLDCAYNIDSDQFFIFSCMFDGTLFLSEIMEDGPIVSVKSDQAGHTDAISTVGSLGNIVITGGEDGRLCFWEV